MLKGASCKLILISHVPKRFLLNSVFNLIEFYTIRHLRNLSENANYPDPVDHPMSGEHFSLLSGRIITIPILLYIIQIIHKL